MTKNKYLSLILFLIITFAASAIGGFTTSVNKEPWYSEIILPSYNPPSWVFGPVWSTLYVFMSIAIWKAWDLTRNKQLLKIYFLHLFFNATWSVIFFGFHNIGLALVDLIIILLFITLLMKIYYKVSKTSFYLMVPYLIWTSYAFILNTSIFILN